MDKLAQISRGTDGDDTLQGGDTMDDIQLGGKGHDKLYGNSGRSDRPVHPKDESGISGILYTGWRDGYQSYPEQNGESSGHCLDSSGKAKGIVRKKNVTECISTNYVTSARNVIARAYWNARQRLISHDIEKRP